MAYKEERIWLEFDIPKPKGAIEATRCMTMTRQEAIERMAKSLFKVDNVLALDIKWSQLKKSKQLVYKEFAEAALNALLEVQK